ARPRLVFSPQPAGTGAAARRAPAGAPPGRQAAGRAGPAPHGRRGAGEQRKSQRREALAGGRGLAPAAQPLPGAGLRRGG
nr:hypothetical protein [Tanacetum cinerariifolium]